MTARSYVPAYLATMFSGIDTESHTYEEVIAMANRKQMTDYLSGLTKGMLRGR